MKKAVLDFGWKSKRYRLGYLNAVKEFYGNSKDRESSDDGSLAKQGHEETKEDAKT